MDNALAAARAAQRPHEQADPWGVGLFGTISDSHLHYNADSALRMNNLNLVAGAVKLWSAPLSEILAGVFFDAGFGAYRSSRDTGGISFGANGKTSYRGGGLLFRYGRVKGALRGAYAEAAVRAGSLNVDYRSEDLTELALRDASYDVSMPYYGGHGGLGYVWKPGEKSALDIYGKFFWTHIDGCTTVIAGDPFAFQPVDSLRLRVGCASLSARANGSRLTWAPLMNVNWTAGSAARFTICPFPATVLPVIRASESWGWPCGPIRKAIFPWSSAMQGFVGKREGVAGNLRLQYAF